MRAVHDRSLDRGEAAAIRYPLRKRSPRTFSASRNQRFFGRRDTRNKKRPPNRSVGKEEKKGTRRRSRNGSTASGEEAEYRMTSEFAMVDAHVHFWDPTKHYYPWLNDKPPIPFRYGDYTAICHPYYPADHLADARARGHHFVKTVYLEAEWDPHDPKGEMDFIAEMRRDTGMPNVAIAQAWLNRDDVAAVLEHHATRPFVRGVRHKPYGPSTAKEHPPSLMTDAKWRKGFALLKPLGLQFDLQTPWWYLDEATALANAFPDTRIILLHSGLPADRSVEGLAAWKEAMAGFARCENVAVKISGIGLPGVPWSTTNNRYVVRTIIDLFGPDRCMFGSNFPVDSVCGDIGTIFDGYKAITADFSLDERKKMFHDNAIRYYRIDD
jgi:predicted TIM-barrel fold metal-dependent hydrolase